MCNSCVKFENKEATLRLKETKTLFYGQVKLNTDFIIRYFCGRKMNAGISASFDLLDQRMHFE